MSENPIIDAWLEHFAAEHGVPLDFAKSVMKHESGGKPDALSPKGAFGPMQLMPGTANALNVDSEDMKQNIEGGIKYLKEQLERFNGDTSLAAAAYNAGPERVEKAGGVPNIPETQKFVKNVTGGMDILGEARAEAEAMSAPTPAPEGDILAEARAEAVPPKPPVKVTVGGELGEDPFASNVPLNEIDRLMASGILKGTEGLLWLLGLPHEKITKPLVVEPLRRRLKALGMEKIQTPTASMLMGELAGTLPAEDLQEEIPVPLASILAESAGLGADIPIYGTINKIVRGARAGYRMARETKAAAAAEVAEKAKMAEIAEQGAKDIAAKEAKYLSEPVSGPTPVKQPEIGAPEVAVAGKTSEQLAEELRAIDLLGQQRGYAPTAEVGGLETVQRGWPLQGRPMIEPATEFRPRTAGYPVAEELPTIERGRAIGGVGIEEAKYGGVKGAPKEIPDIGTGERGALRKYYSGGPEAEDIYNAFKKAISEPGAVPSAVVGKLASEFKVSPQEIASAVRLAAKGGVGITKTATPGMLSQYVEPLKAKYVKTEGHRTFSTDPHRDMTESPIRYFQRLDDDAPGLKADIYNRQKAVEKASKIEYDELDAWNRSLEKATGRGSGRNIMAHAISQQKGGDKLLAELKIRPKPLTAKEQLAYNEMRDKLDDFFVRINEARVKAGQKPLEPVENYFTWMRQVVKDSADYISPLGVAPDHYKKLLPSWAYETKRVRSELPVVMDAFKVFRRYGKQTTNWINQAPHSYAVKEFSKELKKAGMGKIAASMDEWLHQISGWHRPLWTDRTWNRFFNKIGRNIGVSTLSGYVRTAAIQPTSLVYANAELGPLNTIGGIMDFATNPKLRRFAMEHSNVLRPREFDVHIQEAIESLMNPGVLRRAQKAIGTAGYWPLKVLDHGAATSTWLGAFRRGRKLGLEGEALWRYADDVVIRTQGSSVPSDLTRLQSSEAGKLLTMFQTFVINEWNLVTRDILGYRSAVTPTKERIRKAVNLITGGMLANTLMEDVVGMPSPLPSPIGSAAKEWKKSKLKGTLAAVGELSTMAPMVGGSYYLGQFGGPVFRYLGEVAGQLKNPNRKALWLLAQGLGVPGTVQMERLSRVPGKLTAKEALLGKPYEPPPPSDREPSEAQIMKGRSYMMDPFLHILRDFD